MRIADILNIEQLEVLFTQWENVTGVRMLLADEEDNILIGEGALSEYRTAVTADGEVLAHVCAAEEEEGENAVVHGKEIDALAAVINKMAAVELDRMADKELSTTVHEAVQKTSVYIQKINDITKQLDKIEKNQKILALNASIEAARAGEAGKGFAIVAGNVSQLATDFGNNNREIKAELQNLNDVMAEIEKTGRNK